MLRKECKFSRDKLWCAISVWRRLMWMDYFDWITQKIVYFLRFLSIFLFVCVSLFVLLCFPWTLWVFVNIYISCYEFKIFVSAFIPLNQKLTIPLAVMKVEMKAAWAMSCAHSISHVPFLLSFFCFFFFLFSVHFFGYRWANCNAFVFIVQIKTIPFFFENK